MSTDGIAASLSQKLYGAISKGTTFTMPTTGSAVFKVIEVLSDPITGYYGAVIQDQSSGGKTYLVNRGTEIFSANDLANDVNIGIGNVPAQFGSMLDLATMATTDYGAIRSNKEKKSP